MTSEQMRQQFNQRNLAAFRQLFMTLEDVAVTAVNGRHRSAFVGPRWVRTLAPPSLTVAGLGGWCGKVFRGADGMNLVRRQGRIHEIMPVSLETRPSLIDGRPTLVVAYPAESRWPWPHIVDELRRLDETTLLGMTMAQPLRLHRVAFPFLLRRE